MSSYTWICLIIAFLQLREPPILPALHQRHRDKLPRKDGTQSEFADDLDKLRGFGAKNKDSLAVLLFQFFRFYAHEFDYDKYVLSIRLGKLLTKTEKRWHLGTNNMLCVEEPFNTIRNLGNTADDTSFRGLHMELRRAFDLVAEGKLEECCEQYVFPKEEERIWQKPTPAPRPILVRSSSQQNSGRGGRGGYRGNRQFHRNGNSSRRTSSTVAGYDANATFAQTGIATPMTSQDYLWYQSANPQLGVSHELLASSLNALTAHESMRYQLYQHMNQQVALAHAQRMQSGPSQTTDRSRTNSFDNPPLTAPLRPEFLYGFGIPLQGQPYFHPAYTTFPSSPATTTSEFRRSLHRNTVNSDSGSSTGSGALRSQSQPASRTPMATVQTASGYPTPVQPYHGTLSAQPRHVNGAPIPNFMPDEIADADFDDAPLKPASDSPLDDDGPRFVGYYVNEGSSPVRKVNGFPSPVPAFGDLSQGGQGRRRLSTDQLPQSILDRRMKRTSRSPSPLGHARAFSVGTNSAPLASAPFQVNGKLTPNRAPLVVNGSTPKLTSSLGPGRQPLNGEHFTLEDPSFDNPLHINQGQAFNSSWVEQPNLYLSHTVDHSPSAFPERPVIVNGSSSGRSPVPAPPAADVSMQQRVAVAAALTNGIPYSTLTGDLNDTNGFPSPSTARSRMISRQQQNGIAPLDLATGDFAIVQDMQHLSPVYENRTPSPTAVRHFNAPTVSQPPATTSGKDARVEPLKGVQKTPLPKTLPTGPSARQDSTNRSSISDPKVNGVAKENGHVRAAKCQNENSGAWQRQKPRKKGASDLKNVSNGLVHGEQLPKNDADRKGG